MVTKENKKRLNFNKPKLDYYLADFFDCDDKVTYEEIQEMMQLDETSSIAYRSLYMLISSSIGAYSHPDSRIQAEISDMLSSMSYSLKSLWMEFCKVFPYGYVYGERIHEIQNNKAKLIDFVFYPQNAITFDFSNSQKKVTFYGNTQQQLDYVHGFHLTNDNLMNFHYNPYGNSLARRAIKYWKLSNIVYKAYTKVAQKQATKLLIVKTDTSLEVDTGKTDILTGEPIVVSNASLMVEALEQTENSSILVLDTSDEITTVDQTHDGEFFLDILYHCDDKRFRSFLHPSTFFATSKSGVGDSGLALTQQENLMRIIYSYAEHFSTQFINQVIKPIIDFNYGNIQNYGSFNIVKNDVNAIEIAKVIASCLDQLDDSAKDKLKTLLGIV